MPIFETEFHLIKKMKLGAVYKEKVYRNKDTGEIKKEYVNSGLSGVSYEPLAFADFSYQTQANPNGI